MRTLLLFALTSVVAIGIELTLRPTSQDVVPAQPSLITAAAKGDTASTDEHLEPRTRSPADKPPALEHTTAEAKYRVLLARMHPAHHATLVSLLSLRERAAARADATLLATLEQQIAAVIPLEQQELYERLRSSDSEQMDVVKFARQLESTEPLTQEQEDQLLLARLEAKAALLQASESTLSANPSSAMERAYVDEMTAEALQQHSHAYLEAAHEVLSETQWFALAELEHRALRDRLQASEAAVELSEPSAL